MIMEDPQSQESVPKATISQMEPETDKALAVQQKKEAEKKARKFRKEGSGPMGVTDISNSARRIKIPESAKNIIKIIGESALIGAIINAAFIPFGAQFNFYSWATWGALYWLVKVKAPEIVKGYK